MRHVKLVVGLFLFLTTTTTIALAQNQPQDLGACKSSGKVGCVIPHLFGAGITLDQGPGDHVAHFEETQEFFNNFVPLNAAIATQLALLPIPSPASGFTYSYEQITGARTRTPQTFGPILAERGETIGRGRFLFGANYQRFRFDKLDGNDLGSLPGVLKHIPTGRATDDIITTSTDFNLKVNQFSFLGIVGLTPSLDVAVAVPVNDVRLHLSSTATIQRITQTINPANGVCPAGGTDPCHFFDANNKQGSTTKRFEDGGTATGLGDVTVRAKYTIANTENFAIAAVTDIRFPSGDERNFLGSGAWGVKPLAAITYKRGVMAPHVNIGFQWNGKSVLAGNLLTGEKRDLPNTFYYAAGTDVGVIQGRLTVVLDAVGQRLFDGPQVVVGSYTAANQAQYRQVEAKEDNFGINSAAIGAKVKLSRQLLLTGNALFRLDNGGLRERVLPLVGLSYVF